jgi:outer membrane receptor for ferrienterochelin and colicin
MHQKEWIFLFLLTFLFTLSSNISVAQSGTIRGTITDKNTGETVVGASVIVEGTFTGTAANLDGEFVIPNLDPGKISIRVSFISYETVIIDDVIIEPGRTTYLDVLLEEASLSIEGVEVVARRVTHTEMSVISAIRAANVVASGISAQQISRSQDSDAAAVVKRIPGVTLVDNRFIMVRGLSERYNATLLHGIYAPSMEADIRSFSFDIIPSNLLERILIFKSPSPDLPGDFAGGVIKVYTKTLPEDDNLSVTYSSGFDTQTSLGDFYTQQNGRFHWFGFNNGYHALPGDFPENIRTISGNHEAVARAGKSLGNNWTPSKTNAGLNHSFSLSGGKKFSPGSFDIGNISAITYSNSRSTDNVSRADFNNYDMVNRTISHIYEFNDNQNSERIRLGFMHNWTVTYGGNHSLEFRNLFNQLSNTQYIYRSGPHHDFGFYADNHSFHTVYRGIYAGQLSGKHDLFNNRTSLEWAAGYGYSFRDEPDYRRYRSDLDTNSGDLTLYVPFGAAAAYFLGRFYSEMEEKNYTASASLTHRLVFRNRPNFVPEISAGVFFEEKDRFFKARNMGYVRSSIHTFDQALLERPIDYLFKEENINPTTGIRIDEQTNPSDSYDASNELKAGYLMVNIPFTRKLRLVGGVRIEDNEQRLNSFTLTNQPINVAYPVTSLLPSANLSYNLTGKMLIRAAFGKTVNRPEFRELAPFGFYDFNFNLVKKGNELLQSSTAINYDLRWEYYPSPGEVVSVGLFYKEFNGPIETSFVPGGGSGGIKTFTYSNADQAISRGIEVEVRKSLAGIVPSGFLNQFSLLFNGALINSRVELGKAGLAQSKTERPMFGQSPYIVNAGVYYRNEAGDLQVNLLYNVIGKRIFIIGYDDYPDIYEMPKSNLDLTITKGIGSRLEIKAGIRDILNSDIILMQDANQDGTFDIATDHVIQRYKPGTVINFGLGFKF